MRIRAGCAVLLLLAVGLVIAACGGGDEPASEQPPAEAGAAPLPEETPADAVAGGDSAPPSAIAADAAPAGRLGLSDYLIITLAIDAEWNRGLADLRSQLGGVALQRELAQRLRERLQSLSGMLPPQPAQDYHRSLQEVSSRLRAGLEGEEPVDLPELLSDFEVVNAQGFRLARAVLAEEGDDPLNRYLLAAVEVRLESARALRAFGQEAQEAFLSLQTAEDLAAIFVLIERFIADFEAEVERWRQLSPPVEARALHQRQLDVLADTIAVERQILAALEGLVNAEQRGDLQQEDLAPLLATFGSAEEVSIAGTYLLADWNELLIAALEP